MSQCSECRCDLPGFQALCQPCYDRHYAELGQNPKRFLRRLTRRSALILVGVCVFSVLRVRIGRYIDPYPVTNSAALIIGLVWARSRFI